MKLTINALINNNADVNAESINLQTPFHFAALKDNIIAADIMIPNAEIKVKLINLKLFFNI